MTIPRRWITALIAAWAAGSATSTLATPGVEFHGVVLSNYSQTAADGSGVVADYGAQLYFNGTDLASLSNIPDSVTFGSAGPLLPGHQASISFAPFAPDPVISAGPGYTLFAGGHPPDPDPGWEFFSASLYLSAPTLSDVAGSMSAELHGGDFDGLLGSFTPDLTQLPGTPLLSAAAFNTLNHIVASQQTLLEFTAPVPAGEAYAYAVFEDLGGGAQNLLAFGWLNPGELSFILSPDLFHAGAQYGIQLQAIHNVGPDTYLASNLLNFSVPEEGASVPEGGASAAYLAAAVALLAARRRRAC